MTTTVWVDGEVAQAGKASVDALDHGLTVGDGVFETCKITAGRPFALTRHLRRLRRSAGVLGLECPPEDAVREAVGATLEAAGEIGFGRLRITVTGGPGPLGSERVEGAGTLVVAVSPAHPWPDDVAVVTVPWTRNETSAVAGAKTTSYAENVVALRAARARGAHEALLANTRGMLCEGTGSNVLLALEGVLVTPPLSSGCLAGITRELLLEWAADEGVAVEEREVPMAALAQAQDVLLTSSTRDVQPVNVLDGRRLDGGVLGRAAAELFSRRAALAVDP